MAKKALRSREKTDRAKQVADKFELAKVMMGDGFAKRNPWELPPGNTKVSFGLNGGFNKKADELRITVHFHLASPPPDKEPLVEIAANFYLIYKAIEAVSFSDDDYAAFAEMTAPFNAWPFWREFVHSSTLRMGLPALTLPLFRVTTFEPAQRKTRKRTKGRQSSNGGGKSVK